MDDFAMWLVPVGAILVPLVTSLVKSPLWPKWAKVTCAVVVSGVFAFLTVGVQEGWTNWRDVITSSGMIWAIAQATYLGVWDQTTLDRAVAGVRVPLLH